MKSIHGIPVVISKGTPYEIGYSHGSQAADRVRKTFEYNCAAFIDKTVTRKEAEQLAARFAGNVGRWRPEYLEEIRGIADGSGLSFMDIMILNCRTEMQKMKWNRQDREGAWALNETFRRAAEMKESGSVWSGAHEHCTGIAVTAERSADHANYVGQNWDNCIWSEECLIFHVIGQNGGRPSIAYCGEAGIISRSGMNSAGIGSCVNSLTTNAPVNLDGIPLQFLLRAVLDARDLAEAIDACTNGRSGAVNNILLASASGDAVDLEMDTDCCGMIYKNDGILVHTNHYESAGHPRQPYHNYISGSSFLRKNRADALLRQVKGGITRADIERVFADHGNAPSGCICRHPSEENPSKDQLETVMSFICNLDALEFSLAPHFACEGYETFRPFDLLEG